MSDNHVNPDGFESVEDQLSESSTEEAKVDAFDNESLPTTECHSVPLNAIRRPTAPDPEKLRELIARKTAGDLTEADIMQLAIDTTPTEEEPVHGEPFVPSGEVTTSKNTGQSELPTLMTSEQLGMSDGNLDDDPRFDTVNPLHDPITPEDIKNTLQMSKNDLATPAPQSKSASLQMTMKTPTAATQLPSTDDTEFTLAQDVKVEQDEPATTEAQAGTPAMEQLDTELIPVDNDPIIKPAVTEPKGIDLGSPETWIGATTDPTIEEVSESAETTDKLKAIHDAVPPYTIPKESEAENSPVTLTAPSHTEVADQLLGKGAGQELDNALQQLPVVEHSTTDDLVNVNPDQVNAVDNDELTADDALLLVANTTGRMLFEDAYQDIPDLQQIVSLTTEEPNNGSLVIPLADADLLGQIVVQTNPVLLAGANKEMFNEADPALCQQVQKKIIDINEKITDPSSYLYRLRMANEFISTDTTNFNAKVLKSAFDNYKEKTGKDLRMSRGVKLKTVSDTGEENIKIVDDSLGDKEKLISRLGDQVTVAGPMAFKTASLLISGIRKLNLYHSGFNVVICAPRLDLLTKYSNAVRYNAGDYGRILGKLAFLPVGVEIRAALFDLFEKVVTDSNLEGWDQPGVLRNAISSLDYATILWGIASLMYPQGVDVEYVCYNQLENNQQCHHTEKATIDINGMRFNNWSLLNTESISYTDSKTKRSLSDLKEYRKKYLNDVLCWEPISEDGCWKVAFSVPTIAEAEEAQRSYVAELISTIQLNKSNEINQYVQAKYLNSFVPYVQMVSYTSPTQGNVIYFKDGAALANALDNLQLMPGLSLGDKIVEFISSKTLTHICFAHHPCPVCGKYPKEAVNRLIACDPEYAFFQWATSRIPQ